MDQQSVTPFSTASVIDSAGQAWDEVGAVAESLPRSLHSTFKRFFPTDFPACHAPINAAIAEYLKVGTFFSSHNNLFFNFLMRNGPLLQKNSIPPTNPSQFKTGGYVFFPGKSKVGETFTMIIPLHIAGEVQIEGHQLDKSRYYHILKSCYIDVSEGAKLVALIIDSE
jgi:hypothetical protein